MTKEELLRDWVESYPRLRDREYNNSDVSAIIENSFLQGWDACEYSLKVKAEKLYNEGKIDSYALKLLFEDEQHPVDAGREKAKEKH